MRCRGHSTNQFQSWSLTKGAGKTPCIRHLCQLRTCDGYTLLSDGAARQTATTPSLPVKTARRKRDDNAHSAANANTRRCWGATQQFVCSMQRPSRTDNKLHNTATHAGFFKPINSQIIEIRQLSDAWKWDAVFRSEPMRFSTDTWSLLLLLQLSHGTQMFPQDDLIQLKRSLIFNRTPK